MGYRPPGGVPGTLAGIGLLVVFALCLSWVWTALGLVSTGTVVLFPLTLASNVFVQPRTMPAIMGRLVPSGSIRAPRVVSKTGRSAAHARGCRRALRSHWARLPKPAATM
jgi:hypothetical protein